MKYAFNSASTPLLTLSEILDAAVRYGYDGLEIRSGVGHRHEIELESSPALRIRLRKKAEAAGIALCCLGISCRYSNPDEADAQIQLTKAYILLAKDVGIPLVRVFCGRIPAGFTREESKISIIRSLRYLGPFSRKQGVTLVVETHDDWSGPAVMAELLEEIGDPNVLAAWDILHTLHDGDAKPEEVVGLLGWWIHHVHFHDGIRKTEGDLTHHPAYRSLGTGDIAYASIAKLLLDMDYKGYISGEWFDWEPYEIHLPRELRIAQMLEQQAAQGGN